MLLGYKIRGLPYPQITQNEMSKKITIISQVLKLCHGIK